jgi:broad specificity phosphatase PhoE
VSDPATFYFIRHGESEGNARRVFTGQSDSPLTERGRRQAEAVARELASVRFDKVVSSDLSRARDTAEAIAREQGVPVEIVADLREIDVGERTGKGFDETVGVPGWRDDAFVAWPGGETLDQVLARSLGAIDRLARENPGKRIAVIGHGGVTRILLSHFLGILPRLDRSPALNTNISVVVTDGQTHRIERLFEGTHIEDER